MLGLGFFIMIIGSTILVYMTIKAEGGTDDLSDAIKKIILNTLQMVSLAASLPLEWPEPVENMLEAFATLSSCGTSLLVPDCELTHLRTAEAFYLKQIGYAVLPPLVVLVCISVWILLYYSCTKCCKFKPKDVKNYMILTIVLFLFLLFPMLVKACFSMLKCPLVGGKPYLMADLQEPCFEKRHMTNVLALTIPQLILYVIGLPLTGSLIIKRASKETLKSDQNFHMRYGLLYLGYREKREWWECIIAIRKIAIVAIVLLRYQ